MSRKTVLLSIFAVLSGTFASIEVKYGNPVIFSFPCNDNPRYLTQEYHPAPLSSVSNNHNPNETLDSWKGTFYVDQFQNSVNVKLDIILDREASIEVNPRVVHMIDLKSIGRASPPEGSHSSSSTEQMQRFRLITVQPPKALNKIEFTVRGLTGFPSLLSMSVNGLILCDNNNRETNVDLIRGLTTSGGYNGPSTPALSGCGVRHPVLTDTKEELIDWPWKISLSAKETGTNEWSVVCGGTLIGRNRVLTAGSCVNNRAVHQIRVQIGALEHAAVKEINRHSGYDEGTLKDDLAVLHIEDPAEITGQQRFPICIMASLVSSVVMMDEERNQTLGAIDRNDQRFAGLAVRSGLSCLEENRKDFGKYLSTRNLCLFDDKHPHSKILPGDGLYEQIFDDTRQRFVWKIRAVASFTSNGPLSIFTDASKYFSFIGTSFV